MEVHHHAHHGGKKNWKSYIWEFVMLFLAVFCGFLAEWRLEQVIENHREEEYVHSMVEDINADIKQTEYLITELTTRLNVCDSLLLTLSSQEIKQDSRQAHRLWVTAIGFPDFVQNDRTIQQLKSSGGLRLIRNKAASDKIMEYDQSIRQVAVSQNNMNLIAGNTELFTRIFDFIQLSKQTGQPVPLTEGGQKLLNEAYANRFFWKANINGLRQRLKLLNAKGKEVSEEIRKQYHMD
jgi:hypothetical protein